MPHYSYTATDAAGVITKGVRLADSETELLAYLNQSGLMLLDYRVGRLHGIISAMQNISLGGVGRKDLIEFSTSMAVMLRSGVSVIRSLDELHEDLDNRAFKKVIGQLIENIEEGDSLNGAMAKFPKVFPRLYVSAIEIGENTGRLDTIFADLVRHLKRIDDLLRDTRKALIYPSFVMVAMLLAAFVFLVMVFPPLLKMLTEFNVPLPTITKVVMVASNTLQYHWPTVLGVVVAMIVLFFLARKYQKTKYGMDWCELHVPVVKKLFIQIHMAFFMRYLALLLSAGVDILRGLDLCTQSVNNLVLKEVLADCRRQILEGDALSDTFKRSRVIPNMIIRMVKVGEESGTLDEQMELVADQYNVDLSRKIAMALALMEPLLIFMLAGLAMTLVMGVMLPLYNLVSQISTQAGAGG